MTTLKIIESFPNHLEGRFFYITFNHTDPSTQLWVQPNSDAENQLIGTILVENIDTKKRILPVKTTRGVEYYSFHALRTYSKNPIQELFDEYKDFKEGKGRYRKGTDEATHQAAKKK